jgi:hypothetical protein
MDDLTALLPYVSEAPSFAMFVLVFFEIKGLRKELVQQLSSLSPILHRLDERVEK